MVAITFHGGVGEIGGNKILLEDGDSRILLDFGMNFVERSKFVSDVTKVHLPQKDRTYESSKGEWS